MVEPSFSIFLNLYFVYDVQWPKDQFLIFVNVTRDMIMSTMVIVTVAVGMWARAKSESMAL